MDLDKLIKSATFVTLVLNGALTLKKLLSNDKDSEK
jgi:hypothetical protein